MNDQIQVDTQVDQKSVPIEPPTTTQDKLELKSRTPLPKFQLFLVCFIQFAEPLTASVIYPFVNQFVRATGIIQGEWRQICDLNLAEHSLYLAKSSVCLITRDRE